MPKFIVVHSLPKNVLEQMAEVPPEENKMIIDAYNHILPKKYQETVDKKVTGRVPNLASVRWSKTICTLMDLDARCSWGYAMNKMAAGIGDMRKFDIGQALYASLA